MPSSSTGVKGVPMKKSLRLMRKKTAHHYMTRSDGPTLAIDQLIFQLYIQTSNTCAPTVPLSMMRFEQEDSRIISLSASSPQYYDPVEQDLDDLTPDQLECKGYVGYRLPIESIWQDRAGRVVAETRKTFTNRKGYFTIKEVIDAVERFERIDRPKTCWFGGVDCHHVFFEGLRLNRKSTAYTIMWGS